MNCPSCDVRMSGNRDIMHCRKCGYDWVSTTVYEGRLLRKGEKPTGDDVIRSQSRLVPVGEFVIEVRSVRPITHLEWGLALFTLNSRFQESGQDYLEAHLVSRKKKGKRK